MIYALVLTAPGRTIHHVSEGYLDYHAKSAVITQVDDNLENDSELTPKNSFLSYELKGVCKELYEETKSLRLKFNPEVMFSSHCEDPVPATERFLGFFAALFAEQRELVREVELFSGDETCNAINMTCCAINGDKQLLLHLGDVCWYNAHINIKYGLTCFNHKTSRTAFHIAFNGLVKNALLRYNYIVDAMEIDSPARYSTSMLREYLSGRDELDDFGFFYDENGRDMMTAWEHSANKWLSKGFEWRGVQYSSNSGDGPFFCRLGDVVLKNIMYASIRAKTES
ncbi:hypothetical protein HBI11_034470 [Parastagonospora nodorum]|nr:hypothetical protein HBH73_145730 [Parastagonospora nodorum]KAH5322743.1 hypothetical protein HBI11_034470 [Parastagonospora nodorum]KAH6080839.1 hypothetical protein HBI66_071200 [Parastagonospora nodorum]KAH6236624.1 hypothetical protein HBI43_000410 [Parastagonospora nodorum]KAH6413157.1 hypothetical protein HBI08_127930 [Parastagonospora nodorum]